MITSAYGDDVAQVGDLYLPPDVARPPVVVLVHGGFWRPQYERDLMGPLAEDLAARGYAVWNIEYRRVGTEGGGWPGTLTDVASAIDHLEVLAREQPLDLERVVVIGHSAGGQLAVWAAARPTLRDGDPGADPLVTVRAAVSLAGVLDLRTADAEGVGGRAVSQLLGGSHEDVTERYDVASPVERVPIGRPTLLVHGLDDRIVPVSQSRSYAAAADAADDEVELLELASTDHFDVIDRRHDAWGQVVARLPELAGSSR
ncbi:MAG: alpha/beta hydrolase [Actinobacteria bacterium]|nr:alpha/beta hydrolase [Actinomycetota bacterium]